MGGDGAGGIVEVLVGAIPFEHRERPGPPRDDVDRRLFALEGALDHQQRLAAQDVGEFVVDRGWTITLTSPVSSSMVMNMNSFAVSGR